MAEKYIVKEKLLSEATQAKRRCQVQESHIDGQKQDNLKK